MELSNLESIVFRAYDILYNAGVYGAQGVAAVGVFLMKFYNKSSDSLRNDRYDNWVINYIEIERYYKVKEDLSKLLYHINDFSKKDIAIAYKSLMDNKLSKVDALPTQEYYINFMQIFAREIAENHLYYQRAKYIDICVGTGQLLKGFNNEQIKGLDIDSDYLKIAYSFLYFYNEGNIDENFLIKKDSLFSNLEENGAVYLMDPPMGLKLEIPQSDEFQKLQYFLSSQRQKVSSEYLFLSKILFSKENSYYICLVPQTFLTAKDKFKTRFRKFLFENSLRAVIYAPSEQKKLNKVILVGSTSQERDKRAPIYFISSKTDNIAGDDIIEVAHFCMLSREYIETKFFGNIQVRCMSINELVTNDLNINMQYSEQERKRQKVTSLEEIFLALEQLKQKYVTAANGLQQILKNPYSEQKKKEEIRSNIAISDSIKIIHVKHEEQEPWFYKKNSKIEIALDKLASSENDWVVLQDNSVDLYTLTQYIEDLKILFDANRLKVENNKFYIYSQKELSTYKNNKSFWEKIYEFNLKDKKIQQKLNLLSKEQNEIYKALIQYHYDEVYKPIELKRKSSEEKVFHNDLFDKFYGNILLSTINTLNALNLLYKLPDVDDTIDKYLPYCPLIDVEILENA